MADESSMAEKRRILREEQISSYRAHAEANADLDLGGRFSEVTTTTFVPAAFAALLGPRERKKGTNPRTPAVFNHPRSFNGNRRCGGT